MSGVVLIALIAPPDAAVTAKAPADILSGALKIPTTSHSPKTNHAPSNFLRSNGFVLVREGVKRRQSFLLILLLGTIFVPAVEPQSLADLAKKEAERRKLLEKRGVKAKVITREDLRSGTGNISQFSRLEKHSPKGGKPRPRGSVKSYRNRLKKLDRDIRAAEGRIRLLRLRMAAEKRSRDLTIRTGRSARQNSNQDRLHWQILELEAKLKQSKRDRSDTFRAGIKAGFLPGELEDRGIIP